MNQEKPGDTHKLHAPSGNQAAQRFAQSCPLRLPSPSVCPFGGACHTCPAPVQAKPTEGGPLTVNEPGDKYEQEADRVADAVLNSAARGGIQPMRMPEPYTHAQRACSACDEEKALQTKPLAEQITPLVQRQIEDEEVEEPEEEEEEPVQTKRGGGQTPRSGSALTAQMRSLQGGGRLLPRSERDFFEPRFGYDFGQVRIHTNNAAATAASTAKARAFTVGQDVVFGAGQYAPGTETGQQLLAHELTHVVQQEQGTKGLVPIKPSRSHAEPKEHLERSGIPKRASLTAQSISIAPRQIQRFDVDECSSEHESEIRNAQAAVRRRITAITGALVPERRSSQAEEILETYFGESAPRLWARIALNLGRISAGLEGATVECENPGEFLYSRACPEGARAYVRTISALFGLGRIHVCQPQFHNQNLPHRMRILVHEAAHRCISVFHQANYDLLTCRETADTRDLSDSERRRNVDSYACLVYAFENLSRWQALRHLIHGQIEEDEEEETVQPKLAESAQVQRQEEELVQTKLTEGARIQRQEEEPEEEEEEPIQTKRGGGQTPRSGSALTAQMRSLQGGGQPLPRSVRSFFEPRFGYDFSQVRVHAGSQADTAAHAVNARAFTLGRDIVFGADQYQPETSGGRHLLAHELVHAIQQRAKTGFAQNAVLQRDLALQPPATAGPARELSPQEVRTAIQFNRRRYNEESIQLIQDVVGVEVTGTMNEETVRAIAFMQHEFGLGVDGRVGSDTFDLLVRELTAERVSTDRCLTSFQIVGPGPVGLAVSGPSRANMVSRFRVRARFSPRCGCGDFDYRQYICGTVFRIRRGTRTDLKGEFTRLPARELKSCPDWREDGDTSLPAGVGPHYGHRNEGGAPEDRYLPQRRTGCIYEGLDRPGLRNYLVQSGDTYEFNIRFYGDIRRRIGRRRQRIERKFWRIRDTVWIP